jgi:hypothetical protein
MRGAALQNADDRKEARDMVTDLEELEESCPGE